MTRLEDLIQQQVSMATVATLSRATERIAEEMAQEMLKDTAFRANLQRLIKRAFEQAWVALGEEHTP